MLALGIAVPASAASAPEPQAAQTGIASWYGAKLHGHRTASGERFDMNALTCAHRSLPLGTWLRVTNLENLKSIFVRVTDRGPGSRSRILDLSRAAARRLNIGGLGKVRIEPLRNGDQMASASMGMDTLSQLPPPPRVMITPRP